VDRLRQARRDSGPNTPFNVDGATDCEHRNDQGPPSKMPEPARMSGAKYSPVACQHHARTKTGAQTNRQIGESATMKTMIGKADPRPAAPQRAWRARDGNKAPLDLKPDP